MTWRREDSTQRSATPGMRSKVERTTAPPVPVPQEIVDEQGEPTTSVFGAMGIGENGQGIFGEAARMPQDLERQLLRENGWIPERQWDYVRAWMTRTTEAV